MAHELAGKTVQLKKSSEWEEGTEYRVEDSLNQVNDNPGTPAYFFGMQRIVRDGVETTGMSDPDLLYGKIGPLGYAVHASEVLQSATA